MLTKHIEVEFTEEIIASGMAIVAIPASKINPYYQLAAFPVGPDTKPGDVMHVPYEIYAG